MSAATGPSARTAVAGVVGDPVGHSLSPTLFNAAFAALAIDWVYVAFPVVEPHAVGAFRGAVALGVRGLSVTMPHKQAAAAAADSRSTTVERLGAANTVVVRGGKLHADSTDGAGLIADLARGAGFDPAGRRCVVLGAGGAGRAVVLALAEAGAADVAVVNRTEDRAAEAARLAGSSGRVGVLSDLVAADLVVKATPVGMSGWPEGGGGRLPVLTRGQLVVDLVYVPETTPFLTDAESGGATCRNGLGMLVHQAALQFELWTGERAPLEAMWAAARAATRAR